MSDRSSKKVHEFWLWFAQNEEMLFNFEHDGERTFEELSAALARMSPDLCFEFGPIKNEVRDFVVSAGGIKMAFPAVEALVTAAPTLTRWNLIKFRPRRSPIMTVSFGGRTVDPDSVACSLLSNGQELGVFLYFDGYCEEDRPVWDQIGYLLLDDALGEFDVETKIGLIKFLAADGHPNAPRFPLSCLAEKFDELSEFVKLK